MSTHSLLHSIKARIGVGGCPDTVAHDVLALLRDHPPEVIRNGPRCASGLWRPAFDAIIRELDGERRP